MSDEIVKLIQYNSIYLIEIIIDELDLVKTPSVSKKIKELLHDIEQPRVIIILDRLSYIDSTGISYLVMIGREFESQGGKLAVVCKRETILQVFDAVQIENFIHVFPTVDASEKYFEKTE
jgi:anti-anti-sigma factor